MKNIIYYGLFVCMFTSVAFGEDIKLKEQSNIHQLSPEIGLLRNYLDMGNQDKSPQEVMSQRDKIVSVLGDNLPYIMKNLNKMVNNVEQRSRFIVLLSYLPAKRYVEFLNMYALQYDLENKYDQILLENIFGEEGLHPYFLDWNYKNKTIRQICHLLLDKIPISHLASERIQKILSGDSYKEILISHMREEHDPPEILSRDDWAEEFKQWGPPYKVQAAQMKKCGDLLDQFIKAHNEDDPTKLVKNLIELCKDFIPQLQILHTYKQIENKEDWQKLILSFRALRDKISSGNVSNRKKLGQLQLYLDTNPQEKKKLMESLQGIADFLKKPSDLQEAVYLLEHGQSKKQSLEENCTN